LILVLKNPFFGRESGGAVIESPWFERPRDRIKRLLEGDGLCRNRRSGGGLEKARS